MERQIILTSKTWTNEQIEFWKEEGELTVNIKDIKINIKELHDIIKKW